MPARGLVVTTLTPFPKFHAYWVIGAPAGALEALASNKPMKPHLLWITMARAVNEAVRGVWAVAGCADVATSARTANAGMTARCRCRIFESRVERSMDDLQVVVVGLALQHRSVMRTRFRAQTAVTCSPSGEWPPSHCRDSQGCMFEGFLAALGRGLAGMTSWGCCSTVAKRWLRPCPRCRPICRRRAQTPLRSRCRGTGSRSCRTGRWAVVAGSTQM